MSNKKEPSHAEAVQVETGKIRKEVRMESTPGPSTDGTPADSSIKTTAKDVVDGQRAPVNIHIKVGMVGDPAVGKTSLMVKYVENRFDEDYIQTLGINFMEKIVSLREKTATFTIFDLGGESEFKGMMPLVCADASAMLFMFDLTRRSTLQSVKEWYRQARGFNQSFIPFLVGTKFDLFSTQPTERQESTVAHARKYAKGMRAPLVFTSSSHSINVQKLFKLVLAQRYNLKVNVPKLTKLGEPLIEY
mmetsp:Transcript_645/g.2151  ORF Transcript_645/g.2151 Transcript_645/m.2151 type:complete len:247 (+) Transcript_645:278-1018(+)|eukprot:CAMPEP_0198733818 /NCGR_PEP_ID=MMETSP1475-20131203/48477_1 /TAXON_ID= ORGANISM="Unidentified sp., Strain CCMP1999" /NCGR_SAMPLE_ID=MMETSP1475 /ASSEMBLY_ACC=CAM_ASM_001111 /LENGTH=246 /DNA_ID=CAMNT_0044497175 /DNA_START=215 /DNA_END=955 /DNA_ORIENTATION=-